MSDLFKKIVSPFVEFKEGERKAPEAPEELQSPPVQPAAPALISAQELADDPDVKRVQQATALLETLPLSEIPVEKARGLIVATLRFAGMEVEELLASFKRVHELYRLSIESEREAIAQRKQQHDEMVTKLQTALAMEKEAFESEVAERNRRIETAGSGLAKIDQASAFFRTEP